MTERLQKFLAEAGLGSRRHCEELIRAGRVAVDGTTAELGASIDPEAAEVLVDGHRVTREKKEYWLLNKPAGARVFPVGRLDLSSTGLLILTNDGELAARLLHPRYHVEKEYVVAVRGTVDRSSLGRLRTGVALEDGTTSQATVELVSTDRSRSGKISSTLRVVIHEGRKRQVRRMFEAVGHRVIALHRSRFDGLTDAGLAVGHVRPLSSAEIERLYRSSRAG
jgi:23S rRNA pseudouridine2605 synthase